MRIITALALPLATVAAAAAEQPKEEAVAIGPRKIEAVSKG